VTYPHARRRDDVEENGAMHLGKILRPARSTQRNTPCEDFSASRELFRKILKINDLHNTIPWNADFISFASLKRPAKAHSKPHGEGASIFWELFTSYSHGHLSLARRGGQFMKRG
jgi:hypothetical protein